MNIEIEKKEIILEKITAPPSRESLLNLVSWLDRECIVSKDPSSIPYQILVRSIIAVGYYLLNDQGKIETIIETIRGGENYALNPTELNWSVFCNCATMSYPFGPGDGCFSIKELENGSTCKPGSGCISGSGSLASQGLNDSEVMTIIAEELLPWIIGNDDPLISRPQHV
jgi:hypothetical protein